MHFDANTRMVHGCCNGIFWSSSEKLLDIKQIVSGGRPLLLAVQDDRLDENGESNSYEKSDECATRACNDFIEFYLAFLIPKVDDMVPDQIVKEPAMK